MAFAIDTANTLDQINWTTFYNWKPQYPESAGRYFGGGLTWAGTEFTDAKSSTGGVLTHVFPIRACEPSRQEATGPTGHSYGAADGNDTCTRITNAINAGQLQIPASGIVIVYLDVEPGVALSADFWAGFSNEVYNFGFEAAEPFEAGIYTQYVQNASGKYVPQSSVQSALNSSYPKYPSEDTLCYGLWSSDPEPCSYCAPGTVPDWGVFADYNQPYAGVNQLVKLYIYQYAQYGDNQTQQGGCVYTCGDSSFGGGNVIDVDGTASTGAESYGLSIP